MASRVTLTGAQLREVAHRLAQDAGAIAACPAATRHLSGARCYFATAVQWIPRRITARDDLVVFRGAQSSAALRQMVEVEVAAFLHAAREQ